MSIELPKDAEGREIPLDTKVLYDKSGNMRKVQGLEYSPIGGRWKVTFLDSFADWYEKDVYLTPRDSWGMLLDDLNNAEMGGDEAACCYMRRETLDPMIQCEGCKLANNTDKECSYLAYGDIAARIRRLRSEGE